LIQPVSSFVLSELTKAIANDLRLDLKNFAAELGKEPHNLTAQERATANVVTTISPETKQRISDLLLDRLVGWDDGLVQEDGTHLSPDHPTGDGRTVKHLFVESLVGSAPMVVLRVIAEATQMRKVIEGESQGTSGGNGATADTQAGPTASGSSSAEEPTGQKTDADSSEVAVAPA
jgi:hypothetical protein